MEISKSLTEEIVRVQLKLQDAIFEHQMEMNKLETDPNNPDILGQMKRIQVYIYSLGKCQNQVLQRLRTEIEAFEADNANVLKVSIAALLGLNNNHITNNNETKHETAANGFEPSKEDYEEEVVRNGDVHHSPTQDNDCVKLPSPSSVETISGEDDVVAVSMDENSDEKQEEEKQKEYKIESTEKENFLSCLGLITQERCAELQNRRVERKRRSTANPHYVYPTFSQQPSKRRRLCLLTSENAPHTRQTTARMNGPSPPPNKTQPAKSTSPPAQTVTSKSLIPVQKSTTRPNILRNADSKVFVNKNKIEDNQMRSISSAKSVQPISNKAVHIPGLPSSLTIERIGKQHGICICCRNPDSLSVCKICSSTYHVSCHTRAMVPSRTCPRCVLTMDGEDGIVKDEDAEIKRQAEAENKLPRYKKNEKFGKKFSNSRKRKSSSKKSAKRVIDKKVLVPPMSVHLAVALQQRMRQELLGKQEKTQKSIKRLVDFIKLVQLRKSASSPPPSASTTCPPQPSSSQSPQAIPLLQTPSNQKAVISSISNNDKTLNLATTLASSINIHDRASPTSKQMSKVCRSPTRCPATPPVNQKNTNHISSSRKSPNQLEGPISLLAVKPKTKTAPQFSTINCRSVAALPFRPASTPSTPCSTIITSARNKTIAQLPSPVSPYPNCQILLTPSRTTINWTERPSTAESPGPNSQAANSVSISQADQKPYCLSTVTRRTATNQSQSDQQRKQQQQRISTVVASTGQDPAFSSTHCSQAIISPIPSPVVHVSHEASAQTTETIRSCDSSSAVRNTSWNRANSQTTSQQQSSSSGAPSRGSLST